jgi:transcriptional regulator of arginine metabolism
MRGRPSPSGSPASMSARSPSIVAAAIGQPGGGSKRDRQSTIRELVAAGAIGSQQELVDRLIARGFAVTQATVSRDIADLGLVKVPRSNGHVYVLPESLAAEHGTGGAGGAGGSSGGPDRPRPTDERLRRILADIPVTIGRSGLILLVTGSPGTASVIAQAIDESSLSQQEGTLAGDNTLLVLFADEARLVAWRDRFAEIRSNAAAVTGGVTPLLEAR